jgi:hypothetical protein
MRGVRRCCRFCNLARSAVQEFCMLMAYTYDLEVEPGSPAPTTDLPFSAVSGKG